MTVSRVGEDFWCEVDGLSGADQVQGSAGKNINVFFQCRHLFIYQVDLIDKRIYRIVVHR